MTMLYKSSLQNFQSKPVYKLPRKERLYSGLFFMLSFAVIFRLTILIRQRSADSFSSIDSLALIQLSIVGICLLLITVAPRLKTSWMRLSNSGNLYILTYYIFAILSSIWSGLPKYTAYRAIEFITLFYAIYLFIFYSPTFLKAETKVLVTALVIIILDIGKGIKLSGISLGALHTNSYSAVAAMLACYCIAEFFTAKNSRKKNLFRIGTISIFFLIIGTSSASFISFSIGLVLISLLHRNKILLLTAILSLFSCIALFSFIDIKGILFPGKSAHQIMTLTGRIYLWEMYFEMFIKNPLFGNGFAASTRLAERYTTNTHNGLIAVALGTGLTGLAIFIAGIYRIVKDAFFNYRNRTPFSLGIYSALVVGLINNMTISIIGEQWSPVAAGFACFLSLHIMTNPKHKPFRRIVL